METNFKTKNKIKIIELIGDLDGNSATKVREEIMAHIDNNSKLVIDMSKCEYVSSAGLRLLLIIAKKVKAVGGKGVLAGLVDEVKDVMEITGFDHMLTSYETVDQAINSL
ncbi:MAG: STAS domain-containing protein [Bacillota bacterium]